MNTKYHWCHNCTCIYMVITVNLNEFHLCNFVYSKLPDTSSDSWVSWGNSGIRLLELSRLTLVWQMTRQEAVSQIRANLVPPGFSPHPFRKNTPESYLDQLRSIVATYLYRHSVGVLKKQGIDFATYMYVPEIDAVTGKAHHQRADHCHLLKRIAGTQLINAIGYICTEISVSNFYLEL